LIFGYLKIDVNF